MDPPRRTVDGLRPCCSDHAVCTLVCAAVPPIASVFLGLIKNRTTKDAIYERTIERERKAVAMVAKQTHIWLEFALFTAVYIADWKHHIILSKVPYLFVLGWLSLRLRGMRWRDVGFGVYGSWGKTLLVGTLAGVGVEMMELFFTQPLLAHLTGQMPDLSAFDRVAGT